MAHLAHDSGGMLAHKLVRELEAGEDLGEDLSLHNHLRHVHTVLGDLGQGAAHLPLQLGVLVQHQGGQVRYSTCICQQAFSVKLQQAECQLTAGKILGVLVRYQGSLVRYSTYMW